MRIDKKVFVAVVTVIMIVVLVSVVIGIASFADVTTDVEYWTEVEPNNTQETAQVIPLSSGVSASGNEEDDDWFAVNVSEDEHALTLNIRKLASESTTTLHKIYKPNGTTVGPFEDEGDHIVSIHGPDPGTYYVHVKVLESEPIPTYTPPAVSVAGAGEYQLELTLEPWYCQDEAEPNDLATEAQEIPLPSCVNAVGEVGNDDWYKFENAAGMSEPQYRAVEVSLEEVPGTVLAMVAVYEEDEWSAPVASGQGYGGTTISMPQLGMGTYYIAIWFEGDVATYTPPAVGALSSEFEYSLQLLMPLTPPGDSPPPTPTSTPTTPEPTPPPEDAATLSIVDFIPAYPGEDVVVPVQFASNEYEIASAIFSIDFDEECLSFDDTDGDGDGIPDSVAFNLPSEFNAGVTYDGSDTDGELDFSIADTFPPLATLSDSTIVSITLSTTCQPEADAIVAPVAFSDDPAAGFGSTEGQSVPAATVDGSVQIMSSMPGDGNGDGVVDAGDITALVLEIFDGDGNDPADTPGGDFSGNPACDANEDGVVDAGDLSCTVLIIFNGPGACGGSRIASPMMVGPELDIADLVQPDPRCWTAVVPITFTGNGHDIAATIFSVDFDEDHLSFDDTDSDEDGVPDAVVFDLPDGFGGSVTYDEADTDGELDFYVADTMPPLASLSDGTFISVSLQPSLPTYMAIAAPVSFSDEVTASFGSTTGQSVSGTADDGSVLIPSSGEGERVYLPLVVQSGWEPLPPKEGE